MAAALQQAVPVVMAAGRDFPVDRDAQIRADGLAVINQQQAQIVQLQAQVAREQQQGRQSAQQYEDQLFAIAQQRDAAALRQAASDQQIVNLTRAFEQRQAEVVELQRRQVQDAAQIAAGLREITAMGAQLRQEREQNQLLRGQVQLLSNQVQQLTLQIQQLQQMHREYLAVAQKQQQKKEEPSVLAEIGSWALDAIWNGVRGFPQSGFYTKKETL
jgi:hypothetical protein